MIRIYFPTEKLDLTERTALIVWGGGDLVFWFYRYSYNQSITIQGRREEGGTY